MRTHIRHLLLLICVAPLSACAPLAVPETPPLPATPALGDSPFPPALPSDQPGGGGGAIPGGTPFSTPSPGGIQPTLPPDHLVAATPGGPSGITPAPGPFDPQPGDQALNRGPVFLDKIESLIALSYPPQVFLRLAGALPTPCHQLRMEVAKPNAQNRIHVEVYSVVDGSLICVQMLEAFDVTVPLGSFPPGKYTIWVNGQQVGEFES